MPLRVRVVDRVRPIETTSVMRVELRSDTHPWYGMATIPESPRTPVRRHTPTKHLFESVTPPPKIATDPPLPPFPPIPPLPLASWDLFLPNAMEYSPGVEESLALLPLLGCQLQLQTNVALHSDSEI